ncbi:assimilatory sulfite reductase (NADPH) flavoprotein subunit [Lentisalinibacter salinarum]|uniref:assimilatory sulfite reductase (NADPH) flavoprotein subunit n=1 Tax=Lentisalinibacter salinarum TaxID=2992239 RepID=UPI003865D43F
MTGVSADRAADRIQPPLTEDRRERLQAAVADLSDAQLTWASGYLAGLAAAGRASDPASAPPVSAGPDARERLTILYGSQTGNGRRIAEAMQAEAAGRGLASRAVSMAEYRPAELRRETLLAVVVSTHGEGDPPDDAEMLHEFLFGPKAPQLGSLRYSVLALGDSSYAEFCRTGRDFDERLAALGASRFGERVDCDVDYEDPAASWSEAVLDAARERLSAVTPAPRLHAVPSEPPPGVAPGPIMAEVVTNQRITGRDSDKRVHHVEFAAEGLAYEPGDSLALVTRNPPAVVEAVLEAVGLDGGSTLSDGRRLADALAADFEVTKASASFLERYAPASGAASLAELLADGRRKEIAAYLADRQVIDVLHDHPAALSADELVACLRGFKPRLYSIASSPLANPDEVHLTVAAVEYDAWGRRHYGSASTALAALEIGETLEARIEPNPRFRLPADGSAPVVMIGPGTGVAPFRAFLEHREALGADGRNWLFFGDRRFASDFLYQIEWARFRKRGVLDRMDVAFSRDQADKVYVQHRLREHARDLYAWLEEGAHVYVCGDATRMAADVHAALIDVIAEAGGRSPEQAGEYLKELRRAGRYQRDVY